MNKYLSGTELYGDDFSVNEIKKWYDEETEAYANLGSNDESNYKYYYHELNKIHGFNKLPDQKFKDVLGFGSAYGHEFEPILKRIEKLTIIEPSDQLTSNKIGGIVPEYVKPTIKGLLPFEDDRFDLITCFGTLHHIPNVSDVLKEMLRVLKPDGFLLVREPIISMGDWKTPRKGLTKNERGIPVPIFDKLFSPSNLNVISKSYCFTATSFLQRMINRFSNTIIYKHKAYIYIDKWISSLFKWNVRYHATSMMQRIAPFSIFYIVKKRRA